MQALESPMHATSRKAGRRRGVSLVEAIIALAISAILLTATMVATDASFKSYANAAQQASTQSSSRMVMYRMLAMLRNSTEHATAEGTLVLNAQTSNGVAFIDPQGRDLTIEWRSDDQRLVYIERVNPLDPNDTQESILLGGVTSAVFTLVGRRNDAGQLVCERITIDITVLADDDATLELERWDLPEIRLIGSTMPRRLF
jgi:prepilin-type N-terminal cleavage/methylation domain-containing protein